MPGRLSSGRHPMVTPGPPKSPNTMKRAMTPFIDTLRAVSGKPQLPTIPTLAWEAQSQEALLPHTHPIISVYRNRNLHEQTSLYAPTEDSLRALGPAGHAVAGASHSNTAAGGGAEGGQAQRQEQQQQQHGHAQHHHLPEKPPTASALQLVYPFSARTAGAAQLLRQYTQPDEDGQRLYNTTLLLEDLDTFAADVAAKHVDLSDKKLVTAYVDAIHLLRHRHPAAAASASPARQPSSPVGSCTQAGPGPSTSPGHGPANSSADGAGAGTALPPDLHMTGQVTWVGKSSLEVLLEVTTTSSTSTTTAPATDGGSGTSSHGSGHNTSPPRSPSHAAALKAAAASAPSTAGAPGTAGGPAPSPEGRELVATARFVMAARDTSMAKSVAVAKLRPGNDAERALFEEGQAGQHARHHRREQEDQAPLDPTEFDVLSKLLHNLQDASAATAPAQATPGSPRGRGGGGSGLQMQHTKATEAQPAVPQVVSMQSTQRTQSFVTQHKDRNTTGTIFGGQLLAYGYHMGLEVAMAHAGGQHCHLLSMHHVPFLSLVPIGCTLQVSGHVAYVDGPVMQVRVKTFRVDEPAAGEQHGQGQGQAQQAGRNQHHAGHGQHGHQPHRTLTHTFWCTFVAASGAPVAPVVPQTQPEMREWLHARHMHEAMQKPRAHL